MILSRLLYWLVIKPISLLPYPLLYGLSDVFFVIFYYLVGYRKKVVTDNLKGCFPEKSEAEILAIRKKFYRHFCDLVMESLKNFSIPEEEVKKRMKPFGEEILERYYNEGRSCIVCGGHYNNWELWGVAAAPHFKQKLMAIYKQLSNAYFDQKMRKTRGKYGLTLVPTKEVGQFFKDHKNEVTANVFAIDQSPSNPKKAVWIEFMGRETAALYGAEKYAKDYDYPIVYAHLYKVKRGHYEVHYKPFIEHPREFGHGEITLKLHQELEIDIRKAPEYWLWSHKRWKHKRPADENFRP